MGLLTWVGGGLLFQSSQSRRQYLQLTLGFPEAPNQIGRYRQEYDDEEGEKYAHARDWSARQISRAPWPHSRDIIRSAALREIDNRDNSIDFPNVVFPPRNEARC